MRYVAIGVCGAGIIVFGVLIVWSSLFVAPFLICAGLTALGAWDMIQPRHSLRRNYPILANIRFGLETIRPEIRQYFLESDTDGTPFNRAERSVDLTKNSLSYATLVADARGVVTATLVEPGQVVAAGQTAIRVARFAEKEAVVAIPETLVIFGFVIAFFLYGKI